MSLSSYAADLEPLKQFIKRKPLFLSNKNDVEIVASRCSALYLVLSARTENVPKSKELQGLIKEYDERGTVFESVRDVFSRESMISSQSSKNQQRVFAKTYADMTLSNWKQSGDLFKGMVNDDLDVCRDNYAYFDRLADRFSKEIKDNTLKK